MRDRKLLVCVVVIALLCVAVAARAQSAEEWYETGNEYLYAGDYKKAIEHYTKAIEIDPDFALAYNNRGVAYYNMGRYNEAIADYTKAIELDPEYAMAYNNRGVDYYYLGDIKNALADFKRACDLGYKNACDNYDAIK